MGGHDAFEPKGDVGKRWGSGCGYGFAGLSLGGVGGVDLWGGVYVSSSALE
jgi:hypothetical protein